MRGVLPNPDRVLLPGFFVRVRVPLDRQPDALLVPDVALGSDQGGRYVLVVNGDNVVEQRKVQDRAAGRRSARDRERPEGGRSRRRRRAAARDSGPEGRSATAEIEAPRAEIGPP